MIITNSGHRFQKIKWKAMMKNINEKVVDSFGDEWKHYDQSIMTEREAKLAFEDYFSIFPWESLPSGAEGVDMGCGSGRWARFVAPKVGKLHCVDPSDAIDVARKNLSEYSNVVFHRASLDSSELKPLSLDFAYSLGVVHHVPDTGAAIKAIADLLKPGAPLLLYIYYSFENRSELFKFIWRCSDLLRRVICILPSKIKAIVTDIIAAFIYFPLSRMALILELLGLKVDGFPLYYYRNRSFITLRTDSRDRFGTALEKRFSKEEIFQMMQSAGLEKIVFAKNTPYWCALGTKV
jgi:SAM-dependent methyltransferase